MIPSNDRNPIRVEDRLQWNRKDEWIRVDDLPKEITAELKQMPYYAACIALEEYFKEVHKYHS